MSAWHMIRGSKECQYSWNVLQLLWCHYTLNSEKKKLICDHEGLRKININKNMSNVAHVFGIACFIQW